MVASFRLIALAAALALGSTSPLLAGEVEQGRAIYQEGRLPSGAPLRATVDGVGVSGAKAACAACHRRSGLGGVENEVRVLPIAAPFLFPSKPTPGDPATYYSDETLARAVTRGIHRSERPLYPSMPRYALSDTELRALTAYLHTLSADWSPGIVDDTLHLATVIAPGGDPQRKEALLATLRAAVAQYNRSAALAREKGGFALPWQLAVWELGGPPEGWEAQLEARYMKQPVFALLSGYSQGSWEPVHRFCEEQQVPCWFPTVDLPPDETGNYGFYFSRGVALEAEVAASHLAAVTPRPRRVVQILRDETAARGAAQAFAGAVGQRIPVEQRVVRDALAPLLADLEGGDAVLFWLRPADLDALKEQAPPEGVTTLFSAKLGADRSSIPGQWQAGALLVYPFELPQRRRANRGYLHTWLLHNHVTPGDERVQAEAHFAAEFLAASLADMGELLYRDYLVERSTVVLAKRLDAETEERWRVSRPARPHRPRAGTLLYPALRFTGTQRFASEGAFVVRFGRADELEMVGDWIPTTR